MLFRVYFNDQVFKPTARGVLELLGVVAGRAKIKGSSEEDTLPKRTLGISHCSQVSINGWLRNVHMWQGHRGSLSPSGAEDWSLRPPRGRNDPRWPL